MDYMAEQCETCTYWRRLYKAEGDAHNGEGQCLRYPPGLRTDAGLAEWPVTLEDDWCGEYRRLEREHVQPYMDYPIPFHTLSVRCRRVLQRESIGTLDQLANYTQDELLRLKNFGVTSLQEVKALLKTYGMSLKFDTR